MAAVGTKSGLKQDEAPTGAEEVLYSFRGGPDNGKQPVAGVISDGGGNLNGTTAFGGGNDAGVLYELESSGIWTIVYSFPGDGGELNGGVVRDVAGNFYGTTYYGKTGLGQVYKVDPAGQGSILYSFVGGTDGANPNAGVTLDTEGNLYGTTYYDGVGNAGVLYRVDPTGQETVLYSFPGGPDGGNPDAGLVSDLHGNLYGTTYTGGARGLGSVYKIDAQGKETVLHSFMGGTDRANPYASVTLDAEGNLYGATLNGGVTGDLSDFGTIYKIDSTGVETVLHSFDESGVNPYGSLILDAAGNLYGTTAYRGAPVSGSVFELSASGQFTTLHQFPPGGSDGQNPEAGLIRDAAGNLYGTTVNGGSVGLGVVFELQPSGQEIIAHTFMGGSDGANPHSALTRDASGNVYGTTLNGGAANAGVVYKIDALGHETVLYAFTGGSDGGHPYAGVTFDKAGNLYGTTSSGGSSDLGAVYEIDAASHETVLYSFTGATDGATPYGGVSMGPGGNIYGTTFTGGKHSAGVVFELKPTNVEEGN